MKRLFILSSLLVCSLGLYAQDDMTGILSDAADAMQNAPTPTPKPKTFADYFTNSFQADLKFGQTALLNWAAGGDNTMSLDASIDAKANYAKDTRYWNNRLQLDYGFKYASSTPILQKTNDRIYFESRFGHQIKDNFSLTLGFTFKTQFTDGYKYNTPNNIVEGDDDETIKAKWKDARTLISAFFAPAYTDLAVGIDYKPTNWINMNLAPATAGFVFVTDERPDIQKDYGMKLLDNGQYQPYKFEFGCKLTVDADVNINKVFNYNTQVVFFEDYLKDHTKNPCPRINWDNKIQWKIGRFFALTFNCNLIYDDTIMIKNKKDIDIFPDGIDRLQVYESLAFGFTYTIASKSK